MGALGSANLGEVHLEGDTHRHGILDRGAHLRRTHRALEGLAVRVLEFGVVVKLGLAHRRSEDLAVPERSCSWDSVAKRHVLLVAREIDLSLIDDERANHWTSSYRAWSARAYSTASGTSSKRSMSTSPRSVIFSFGITESARKDSIWNGASIVQPSCSTARWHCLDRVSTSARGASASSPATGSGSSARTPRLSTTTTPPWSSESRWTALAMSPSSTPTTTML